ncbi:MAG: hypothetical protein RLY93_13805 [Sumerlaeia bacterium]
MTSPASLSTLLALALWLVSFGVAGATEPTPPIRGAERRGAVEEESDREPPPPPLGETTYVRPGFLPTPARGLPRAPGPPAANATPAATAPAAADIVRMGVVSTRRAEADWVAWEARMRRVSGPALSLVFPSSLGERPDQLMRSMLTRGARYVLIDAADPKAGADLRDQALELRMRPAIFLYGGKDRLSGTTWEVPVVAVTFAAEGRAAAAEALRLTDASRRTGPVWVVSAGDDAARERLVGLLDVWPGDRPLEVVELHGSETTVDLYDRFAVTTQEPAALVLLSEHASEKLMLARRALRTNPPVIATGLTPALESALSGRQVSALVHPDLRELVQRAGSMAREDSTDVVEVPPTVSRP